MLLVAGREVFSRGLVNGVCRLEGVVIAWVDFACGESEILWLLQYPSMRNTVDEVGRIGSNMERRKK